MEKISLKPHFQEILHKGSEDGVFFDILTFSGSTTQEKNLGSIMVLSYLRQKQDDLSYLVSLISSLAKREFYSPQSVAEQDTKAAFERSLKKLNEILVDYFEKKDFTLNLGLAAISGDNIYISRLGKFKVALARNDEYIDILNNVSLFNKDDGSEHQFANIISGKLKPNDKIFAYFPLRTISAREKLLNPVFISENQGDFCNKIDLISENAPNFACCGVHINMLEVKEIPVEPNMDYVVKQSPAIEPARPETPKSFSDKTIDSVLVQTAKYTQKEPEKPVSPIEDKVPNEVIRAQMSITKRGNIFNSVLSAFLALPVFSRRARFGVLNQSRRNNRLVLAVVAVFALAGLSGWWFLGGGGSTGDTSLLDRAKESLMLARSRLAQDDSREARNILRGALALIAGSDKKNIDLIRNDISKTLDIIDQTSDRQPEQFVNASEKNPGFIKISVFGSSVYAVGGDNKLFSVNTGSINELGQFKITPKYFEAGELYVSAFDGVSTIEVYDLKKKTIFSYSLKDAPENQDAVFFQNNLYCLSAGNIYKYADVVSGGVNRTDWGTFSSDGQSVSMAIDGNIYALSSDGKIIRLFKGKKEGEFTIQLVPSEQSNLFAAKDSAFIYLSDLINKRVYVFDKTSGSLKLSYKMENTGQIKDIFVSPDGTVWIASESSVWQIKP